MKFVSRTGDAICVSLVDLGDRLRMICADVEVVEPVADMPNLPVARHGRPLPDLKPLPKHGFTQAVLTTQY